MLPEPPGPPDGAPLPDGGEAAGAGGEPPGVPPPGADAVGCPFSRSSMLGRWSPAMADHLRAMLYPTLPRFGGTRLGTCPTTPGSSCPGAVRSILAIPQHGQPLLILLGADLT